jgi:hypothetical protein
MGLAIRHQPLLDGVHAHDASIAARGCAALLCRLGIVILLNIQVTRPDVVHYLVLLTVKYRILI